MSGKSKDATCDVVLDNGHNESNPLRRLILGGLNALGFRDPDIRSAKITDPARGQTVVFGQGTDVLGPRHTGEGLVEGSSVGAFHVKVKDNQAVSCEVEGRIYPVSQGPKL